MSCARRDLVEGVRCLLESKADINAVTSSGEVRNGTRSPHIILIPPAALSWVQTALYYAAGSSHEAVSLLLSKGVSPLIKTIDGMVRFIVSLLFCVLYCAQCTCYE
jgi:ankyrin repeat protein